MMVATAGLFTGCGGDGDGAVSVATPQQYSAQLAKISCGKMFECCPDGVAFLPDQATCEAFIGGFAGDGLQKAVDEGYTEFNAGPASTCLTAMKALIESSSCEAGFEIDGASLPAECAQALVGQRAEGESCAITDEDNGGSLTSDSHCQPGLVCHGFSEEVCVRPAALDAACSNDIPCVEELRCVRGEDGESACKTKAAIGEDCQGFDSCQAGECKEGKCVAQDFCGG